MSADFDEPAEAAEALDGYLVAVGEAMLAEHGAIGAGHHLGLTGIVVMIKNDVCVWRRLPVGLAQDAEALAKEPRAHSFMGLTVAT